MQAIGHSHLIHISSQCHEPQQFLKYLQAQASLDIASFGSEDVTLFVPHPHVLDTHRSLPL